jgi:hypothetical protein
MNREFTCLPGGEFNRFSLIPIFTNHPMSGIIWLR